MLESQPIAKFMTQEQRAYLDKNDLWTAFDEISRDWDDYVTESTWDDHWELFVGFIE